MGLRLVGDEAPTRQGHVLVKAVWVGECGKMTRGGGEGALGESLARCFPGPATKMSSGAAFPL